MKSLIHYGTPRHSGRYPWGSGDDPQNSRDFLSYVKSLQDEGLSETEIANGLGISTTELRSKRTLARAERRAEDASFAKRLRDKGMSKTAIGKRMGINESSVRALLDETLKERASIVNNVASVLRDNVDKKGIIDVGLGVETHLGISGTKLNSAITQLREEGYKLHYAKVQQLGTGKYTSLKVLTGPDVSLSDIYKNLDKIRTITDYTEDGGRTMLGIEPVRSINSKRVHIRYAEDGGADKDGLIELRRGVPDLSLGNAKYAQVRIGVDDTHFMKGMAIYSDDVPKGFDVIYNTKKPKGTLPNKVFKAMKIDEETELIDQDNPFKSVIRQKHYIDENGNKQLSALNIVNEEGNWEKWSKTISSQALSKQSPALAKKQLDIAYEIKKEEFDEISSLTNPSVKRRLLNSFADDADAAAVHLKAAALPRQGTHVLLPFPDIKPSEVYAPNYQNGERVVLIRHPHGGIFEIPELVVNNKNPAGNLIKNARDAIGIHPDVAKKLSGADFDGDTVLVIPNRGAIKTADTLKSLKDFDPIEAYPAYDGMPKIKPRTKQLKMGDVSNLITDMTIKGANTDEIARAVRHSMVIIDAEKHNLNYKQSYIDNGIAGLKKKYQGSSRSGAATLVSRSKSPIRVNEREDTRRIDPVTGKKIYRETGNTFVNSKGQLVKKTSVSPRMLEVDDAFELSSGTRMESVYATYANNLKALANKARLLMINTKLHEYSSVARKTYEMEVQSLNAKLNLAYRNKPAERQAQLIANKIVSIKRASNPSMTPEDLKKIKGQALIEGRLRAGAKEHSIVITDREWEAIQAGAITPSKLDQILLNTDLDAVKQRSMPRTSSTLSPAKIARARSMKEYGYTNAEIASALGISTNTLSKSLE